MEYRYIFPISGLITIYIYVNCLVVFLCFACRAIGRNMPKNHLYGILVFCLYGIVWIVKETSNNIMKTKFPDIFIDFPHGTVCQIAYLTLVR